MFRVIEGGKRKVSSPKQGSARSACDADVMAEGKRRLAAIGYQQFAVREQMTGICMPTAIKRFRLQINYVVTVLSKLDPVPADFRADVYWPVMPG